MNIAVLSGKGGTGKTTISVNLASVAGGGTNLLDCDVEEPNSHLFIEGEFDSTEPVGVRFPVIDEDKCIHCGKCGEFCRFNAILSTKKINIIMPELCHDCGGCQIVCPIDVITFEERSVGYVRGRTFGKGQQFYDGVLNTGEFSATKIIQKVLTKGLDSRHRIIDAPPGSACAAVEAVEGADFALIVTEPTPFALSDMKMVVEMLEKLNIPMGVFVNKSGESAKELEEYCKSENIKIIGELPFKEEYGRTYANGKILSSKFPEVEVLFKKLWEDITNEA